MRLKNLHEALPQPKKRKTMVWQKEEAQGDKSSEFGSRWYTPTPAHKPVPYRQSKKNFIQAPGEGYEEHILPVGK